MKAVFSKMEIKWRAFDPEYLFTFINNNALQRRESMVENIFMRQQNCIKCFKRIHSLLKNLLSPVSKLNTKIDASTILPDK